MTPNLQAIDLSYQIDRRVILDSLSFDFSAGINWIRGANGTGKTTLLKLLGGALQPSRGRLWIDGQPLADLRDDQRQAIFFCGDDLPDLPWLKAHELVAVYASIYRNIDLVLLDAHLRSFKLTAVLETAIAALSLGERRKLQLAVAFAANLRLLLLDEPLNALDAAAAELTRMELRRRNAAGDQIVLLTSHTDPGVASRAFDLQGGTRSRLDEALG